MWPFMREFSAVRSGYFWIYLIPALLFFLFNGGIFLFGQAHPKDFVSPAKTQHIWGFKNCLAAVAGFAVLWAFQYLPFLVSTAPGFELIGISLFSGMLPLLLFVYIPEFIVLIFILTWFYRKTGKIYRGSFMITSLAIWFLTAGTALNKIISQYR